MINVEEKEHFIILDYEAFKKFFGKYCDLNFTLSANFSIDNEYNASYSGTPLIFAGIYVDKSKAKKPSEYFETWVFVAK